MLCRYTKAEFNGDVIYLAYTVNAMFDVNDLLQDDEQILDYMNGKGKEGFTRFCNVVSILAREGARVRESEGFPRPAMPGHENLLTCLQPMEYVNLKRAAMDAILMGFGREVENEEEIDLELANLEKK